MLENVRCVAVDKKLEKIDPRVFQFLMSFAHDNDLRVLDCRQLIDEVYPSRFLAWTEAARRMYALSCCWRPAS